MHGSQRYRYNAKECLLAASRLLKKSIYEAFSL